MDTTVERSIDTCDQIPLWVPGVPKKDSVIKASEYLDFVKKYGKIAGGQTAPQAQAVIPFIASAHEHTETFPVIKRTYSAKLGSETTEFNVPSYGYIRAIWLDVEMEEHEEKEAEEAEDTYFVAVGNVTFLDTNGAPIFGPLSGYNFYLSNLFGGYVYQQDPKSSAGYNAELGTAYTTAMKENGRFRYQLRIPIEISHHDATGCIGNQNASAPYRVRITLEGAETIYKKEPKKFKASAGLKISPILEAWSLPNAQDALGRPQAQLPPNYGTVQYWSERVQSGITAGLNNIQVLRVGNLLRNVIFIGRETSATGKRNDEVLPEYPILNWDARQLVNETAQYRSVRTLEPLETNVGTPSTARPKGVYAYTFNRTNQDRAGDDKPWLWLPTVEATRLELTGTSKKAGVAVMLINDIAPAEVNPTQRYAVPSATGFHPETGVKNPNIP